MYIIYIYIQSTGIVLWQQLFERPGLQSVISWVSYGQLGAKGRVGRGDADGGGSWRDLRSAHGDALGTGPRSQVGIQRSYLWQILILLSGFTNFSPTLKHHWGLAITVLLGLQLGLQP